MSVVEKLEEALEKRKNLLLGGTPYDLARADEIRWIQKKLKACVIVPRKQFRQFWEDVKTVMAGISWFNVDKEEERVWKFIEDNFPELLEKVEKTK